MALPPNFFDAFEDFERVFNSLFDELLISRWHGKADSANAAQVVVHDRIDHYEVRLTGAGENARQTEIEATERRLLVRLTTPAGPRERAVDFRHLIEPEAVSARLDNGVLTITLPKKRGRKITLG